jgi:hypothetical protein
VGAVNRPSYCCSRSSMTLVETEAKVAGAADVDVADQSTHRPLRMNARVRPQGLEPLHAEYHNKRPQRQAIACEDERLIGHVDGVVGATSQAGDAISIFHCYSKACVALKHVPRTSCYRHINKIVRRPGVQCWCATGFLSRHAQRSLDLHLLPHHRSLQ